MSKFCTKYDFTPDPPEIGSDEYLVDPTGYVSAERQLNAMMFAGVRLDSARKADYDFNGDEPLEEKAEFVLRRNDCELSDAHQLLNSLGRSGSKKTAGSGSGSVGVNHDSSRDKLNQSETKSE